MREAVLVRLPAEGERPLLPENGKTFSDGELMEYMRAVLAMLPASVVEEYSIAVEHDTVISAVRHKVPVHFVVSPYMLPILPGPKTAALEIVASLRDGVDVGTALPVCGVTLALNTCYTDREYAYVLLSEIKDSTPPMPDMPDAE